MRVGIRRQLQRLRLLFLQVYPLLHLTNEGTYLAFQWMYLFRMSAFFSPDLRLTGMVVRRATMDDWVSGKLPTAAGSGGEGVQGGGLGGEGSGLSRLRGKAGQYGRLALIAAVVGFKIMEWWTAMDAQEGARWRGSRATSPPPPPRPPLPAPGGCGVPSDPGACPVCRGSRVNASLCKASGFVFCYGCIAGHIRERGECPVTGLPCGPSSVVKLFDEEGG
ncbi:unnamed protein product [Choristocarpus tenellus]